MLDASGIEILDTISGGEGGILFIEKIIGGDTAAGVGPIK